MKTSRIAASASVGEPGTATALARVATAMGAAWWAQNDSWAPSAIAAAKIRKAS